MTVFSNFTKAIMRFLVLWFVDGYISLNNGCYSPWDCLHHGLIR